MKYFPLGLDLDSLPGPRRGVSPALYVRDEFVFSPSISKFALAYSIAETSMCNEIGCLLWGETGFHGATVLGNPAGVYVTSWRSPWAVWLDDESFVFKAQQYERGRLHVPLVTIHLKLGFAVLPGTNKAESCPSDVTRGPLVFSPVSAQALLHAITSET